jgi:RND family efflux transporter MFP subunit
VKKSLIVLAVLAGAGIGAVLLTGAGATPDRERVSGGEVVRVGRRDIRTVVKATGIIRPMIGAEVRVGSRISGVVRRLLVRVGDTVQKGRLLAELDDREWVARRAEAVGALEVADANLQFARSDLQRRRGLHAEQLIPQADLEVAERACAVAEKQHAQAQANLEYATTQLTYTRILAPIGGIVSSVATQEGETVAAGFATPTFVTLLDLGRLEVRAYVDETDIGRIRAGQSARFTVDTYGDREVPGRVATVYPQAEIRDNVVDYVTVVNFHAPPDLTLRPEMTAAVRIAIDDHPGALTVPLRALRREGGRAYVLCDRNGAVERRWVTTGARDDTGWEIVDGLREGERVVVGERAVK